MWKIFKMFIGLFKPKNKTDNVESNKLDDFYIEIIKEDENKNEIKVKEIIMDSNTIMVNKLRGHVPDNVFEELLDTVNKFELNTPSRLSHFLGQCAHESGDFRIIRENLNYSSDGLMKIFPRHFTDKLEATSYARQPERIANKVYSNRMGNGPESSGEGWKFRGRGYIQLTGKNNYSAFNGFVKENIIEEPDLVATKYPLLSGSWFFHTNGLHRLCDQGVNRDIITLITRRVNGGTHGLEDRVTKTMRYYNILK